MGKVTGRDGRVKYGAAATLSTPGAVHSGGVVTITTAEAHGFVAGDRVSISGVVGMTDLNKSFQVIAAPTTTTFTVSLSTAQTWTSGGSAKHCLEIVMWDKDKTSGEADVSDSSTESYAEFLPAGKIGTTGTIEGILYAEQAYPEISELMDVELIVNDNLKFTGQIFFTGEKTGPVSVPGADAVKISHTWRAAGELIRVYA